MIGACLRSGQRKLRVAAAGADGARVRDPELEELAPARLLRRLLGGMLRLPQVDLLICSAARSRHSHRCDPLQGSLLHS